MDTLEEKLLEKMAHCHGKHEMLCSINTSAYALCRWIELYNDGIFPHKVVNKEIPQILANLELNIQLLKKSYYPNIQEFKEQIVLELAKKYELL